MNIGEYINQYLKTNKLSQRQFAKRCNLSNGYISMLINNVNPKTQKAIVPSLTALLSISKGMGITLDELIKQIEDIDVDISTSKNYTYRYATEETSEFVKLFEKLTPEQQKLIISQIKGILQNGN